MTGYLIRYSLKKNMKNSKIRTVKSWKKTTLTVKNLKGGKRYYMQVRTYAKVNGRRYFSGWSKKKLVKVRR